MMNRDVNLDMEISGAVMGECREKVLPSPPEFHGSLTTTVSRRDPVGTIIMTDEKAPVTQQFCIPTIYIFYSFIYLSIDIIVF